MTFDDFMKLVKSRRSVRRFLDKPVDPELIERAVEAATWAPSAGNRQDWEFAVAADRGVKERLAEEASRKWGEVIEGSGSGALDEVLTGYAGNFDWFTNSPVVIAISCKKPGSFMEALFGDKAAVVSGARASAAMAAENLMLAAHSMGLGTCCITGLLSASDRMCEILKIGKRMEIVCLVAVGYADEAPSSPSRKPLSETMRLVT